MKKTSALDNRLAKADPLRGKKPPRLSNRIISKAATQQSGLGLSNFGLLARKLRLGLAGGAVTAGAAALALVMVVNLNSAPLIKLAGNQGVGARESSALDGGADKMWLPYQSFEYLAGENLSADRGSGQVYKINRIGTPESVLTNVSKIMGVSGTIKKYPDFNESFPGYFLSESEDAWGYDSVNPVISLWWAGSAGWNYSNPAAYPQSRCEETDDSGACSAWTEFKPTPELLPANEVAIAKALEIFNATGLSATKDDLKIYRDDWGVSISSAFQVDGQDTHIEWYVGWSSTGILSYAGGHSIAAQAMGEFETISPIEAVDRISDWRYSGAVGSKYYEQYQPRIVAQTEPAVLEDSKRESAADSSAGDEGEAPSEPVETQEPAEPIEEPIEEPSQPTVQTVQITITDAKPALVSIWDTEGNIWLVPGYLMINDQGWFSAIIALIDGVIELPKETEYDIMPLPADDLPTSDQ